MPMPKAASSARNKLKGGPVRGSRTGRPIMVLLDLFGRRWSLRILWELREAGFIEMVPASGYGLTDLGRELLETLLPLHRFAERWGKREAT